MTTPTTEFDTAKSGCSADSTEWTDAGILAYKCNSQDYRHRQTEHNEAVLRSHLQTMPEPTSAPIAAAASMR